MGVYWDARTCLYIVRHATISLCGTKICSSKKREMENCS